ncbi:MAG: helix-turn-helix transcriptional regulator [Clostridia bacterium]|nr:helix-turn-helix transcriptional regulator [Clostridia bacterium]
MQNIYQDFPGNVRFDYRSVDGTKMEQFHFHSHYEVSIVLCGSLTIINTGETVKTDKPCVILHSPNTFHAVIAEKGTLYKRYNMYFDDEFVSKFPAELLGIRKLFYTNFSVTELESEDLEELMIYTRLIFESEENVNRQYLLLASLVNKLSDYVGTARTLEGNENISYIENVIQYIAENYGEPLTAGVLADKFYVSSAKLNADFKGMTSVTLHKYIVTVRLINAKRMLISGKSVLETSVECGFFNESHFIRTFKEKTGMTPSKYAKMFSKV